MEMRTLIHKLYLDSTHLYSNNKWVFFLFTVYWKKENIVEVSDLQKLRTVYFGLFGSFHKTHMRVQIIIEPRNIERLISWLNILLEKAESIVSYANSWPGNCSLTTLPINDENLAILAGTKKNIRYNTSCDPFLLINDWLSLFLESKDCIFFFCDSFAFIEFDVLNIHLSYSPLFFLKQKKNFIHLTYRGDESQLYYFNCSFAEWWNYRCSPNTVVYHTTVYILNKIAECGLYHVEFELDDDTQFFEKLIRYGFENIPIECSYTYQLPNLYLKNRINLIIGYRIVDLQDIEATASRLFDYLQRLKPTRMFRYASKEIECLSYPNKVSRSIWTQDFRTCKILCRRYACERDDFILDEVLPIASSAYPEVRKDIDYMVENTRDFISVYRHHDPFLKQKIEYNEKIQ